MEGDELVIGRWGGAKQSGSNSWRFPSPPRLMAWRRRACSTRIRRIASAAAAKKCRYPSNVCSPTNRRNASCTSDVASSVWPGCAARAIRVDSQSCTKRFAEARP
jgi:hypothetical protein